MSVLRACPLGGGGCGGREETHPSLLRKRDLGASPGPRWLIDLIEMRQSDKGLLFCSCHSLVVRTVTRSFMACLRKGRPHPYTWAELGVWPALMAGFYDRGCPWPCGRGGLCWEWRGKGGLLLVFSFPPQSGLLAPRKCRHLDQGMTSHKMVLYVFKKDELLFLTYPKKSILPLLNISRSFVPCQVTRRGSLGQTLKGEFQCVTCRRFGWPTFPRRISTDLVRGQTWFNFLDVECTTLMSFNS